MSEDQHIEWKASWRDEYLKWLCGFANAQGGVLEVGRDNQGKVVGLDDVARLMEELPNKLRDLLGIVADIDHLEEDGQPYLRISVEPYPVPISYRGEFHYRSGSTKQVLKGAALSRFLLNKTGKCWDGVPVPGVDVDALDSRALSNFRRRAVRAKRLDADALEGGDRDLLEKLKLMDGQYLKRSAILLFHSDPERFFTNARLKIGYFESESEVLYHDEVQGYLISQVDRAMDLLLTKYLKAVISYEGIQRVETYPVPEDALREAVLNAIIHRDYGTPATIQIRVYENRLYIWNPGELPQDWSLEKLLSQHASKPFNPDVANTFFWAGEIESWGRGIQRIFGACRREGIPDPRLRVGPGELWVEFQFSDTYLHRLGSTTEKTNQEIRQETVQEKILSLLQENPSITKKALAARIGITLGSARHHLENLKKSGHIRHVGPTKKGRWEVSNAYLDFLRPADRNHNILEKPTQETTKKQPRKKSAT